MRRKAHVLQHHTAYRHKSQNTTKKQQYSFFATTNARNTKSYGSQSWKSSNPNILNPQLTPAPPGGQFNNRNQFPVIDDSSAKDCNQVKTQASSSDVPGDPFFLIYLDPSIPLTLSSSGRGYYPSGSVPARKAYKFVQDTPQTIIIPSSDNIVAPQPIPKSSVLETITIEPPSGLVCMSNPGCSQDTSLSNLCGPCPLP